MSSVSTPSVLSVEALERALAVRDLTDPTQGSHAMQLLIDRIGTALGDHWNCPVVVRRASPIVSVADNYDRLGYAPDAVTRDARYTRYVTADTLLRTHSSAMVPAVLRALAAEHDAMPHDVVVLCPGVVYRRDVIDRLHTGEPHQADLWRITSAPLAEGDLHDMIEMVVGAALPGARWRVVPTHHPYTQHGVQVDVATPGEWIEIGECGLAHPAVLAGAGLDTTSYSGLAMGLGLDRLLMLAKGIDDIRLLRSTDARVATQMLDLAPYRPVSDQPAIRRDLSVAVAAEVTAEELGDRVRSALGSRASQIEAVEVLSETPGLDLPRRAAARLGLRPEQKNVLVRLTIRDLDRTLTHAEANALRDAVYAALHEGTAWTWAMRTA